jgi:zinc D-Ala-D-Ala carboxypeptidase
MDSPFKVDHWRWSHFKPTEVLGKAGLNQYMLGNLMIQPRAMDFLEEFRASIGKPIIVNSGYRTQAENRDCGGSILSRHVQGIAFDIRVAELSTDQLFRAAKAFGWGGIGMYLTRGFVHVDCRAVMNGQPVEWQQ